MVVVVVIVGGIRHHVFIALEVDIIEAVLADYIKCRIAAGEAFVCFLLNDMREAYKEQVIILLFLAVIEELTQKHFVSRIEVVAGLVGRQRRIVNLFVYVKLLRCGFVAPEIGVTAHILGKARGHLVPRLGEIVPYSVVLDNREIELASAEVAYSRSRFDILDLVAVERNIVDVVADTRLLLLVVGAVQETVDFNNDQLWRLVALNFLDLRFHRSRRARGCGIRKAGDAVLLIKQSR